MSTKKTVKKSAVKKSTKPAPRKNPILNEDQRSAIGVIAAQRAHLHPTFQKNRKPTERKEQVKKFNAVLKAFRKSFPALVKRNPDLIRAA